MVIAKMSRHNFKLIRQQKGYTQATLAKKLGYSRTQIGDYERGDAEIPKIMALVITLL